MAKDQVDRYLDGANASIDVEYLLYVLSYDALSQLERLDGGMLCGGGSQRLDTLLAERRAEAAADCDDWRSWSLSACLAAGRN